MSKGTARSKFDNSRVTFTTEDGKRHSYTVCTICGKWHKGQYGYDLEYWTDKTSGGTRVKLCGKCVKKVSAIIEELAAVSWNAKPGKDDSEIGKLCENVTHMIFAGCAEDNE